MQAKSIRRRHKRETDPDFRKRENAISRACYYRNPDRRMLNSARQRAKQAGLPFELTVGDIELPDHCPALGIPIRYTPGPRSDDSPSLDRLRPELGYVAGNVRVICDLANRIKQRATHQQIRAVADWLGSELGEIPK